jgi:hypothetical protein
VLVYKEKKKKGAPKLLNQSEESTTCKTGRLVPTLFAYEPYKHDGSSHDLRRPLIFELKKACHHRASCVFLHPPPRTRSSLKLTVALGRLELFIVYHNLERTKLLKS